MILHIPHSSKLIPDKFRDQIVLCDDELEKELIIMTDAHTDELFSYKTVTKIIFPISRLLVDVERYKDDEKEPMSKKGMGVIYTKTSHGKKLRRELSQAEKSELISYYDRHHRLLTEAVEKELQEHERSLIIDCHSFPSKPLPCDQDQTTPRPDICLGKNSFHTPNKLITFCKNQLEELNYDVKINKPYAGTMVPQKFCEKDKRVLSIMIEVNRKLYINEDTGNKNEMFNKTKGYVRSLLKKIQKENNSV